MPDVKALKGFLGSEGFVQPGESITVSEDRHKALSRNGLVHPPAGQGLGVLSNEPGMIKTGGRPERRTPIISKT